MGKYRRLTHVVYKCDYHIVFVPKYRFRVLTGAIKGQMEQDIRTICEWKSVEIEEMNLQSDHVRAYGSVDSSKNINFGVHGDIEG